MTSKINADIAAAAIRRFRISGHFKPARRGAVGGAASRGGVERL
jgi:hypothetical protein